MRMFISTVFMAALLLITLTGCEESTIHSTGTKIPPPSPHSQDAKEDTLDMAEERIKKVRGRREAEYQKMEEKGDFSASSKISEKIFLEELGLEERFWTLLVKAFTEDVPKTDKMSEDLRRFEKFLTQKAEDGLEKFWFEYMGYFDDLVTEYLRLSFKFPEKENEELLLLFRESVKEGRTSILFPEFPEDL